MKPIGFQIRIRFDITYCDQSIGLRIYSCQGSLIKRCLVICCASVNFHLDSRNFYIEVAIDVNKCLEHIEMREMHNQNPLHLVTMVHALPPQCRHIWSCEERAMLGLLGCDALPTIGSVQEDVVVVYNVTIRAIGQWTWVIEEILAYGNRLRSTHYREFP